MRHYQDHRIGEEAGFNDAIQGIVKNSPWWMISAVIHAVLLLILAQIQMDTTGGNKGAQMQASLPDEDEELEEEEEEQPEEEEPEEIEETPIETEEVDDHNEVDTDSEFEETEGEDGMSDSPFTGPSTNSAIGLGGGAGGGRRGRGGKRNLRGGGGSKLTQNAVELGLKWLADHQDVDEDGKWDVDDFMKHDPPDDKCDGPGGALYDVGVHGTLAARLPRCGLHRPRFRARQPLLEERARRPALPHEPAGRGRVLRQPFVPALHVQPLDRLPGDDRGVLDDAQPAL